VKTTTTGRGGTWIETLTITGFGGFFAVVLELLEGVGEAVGDGVAEADGEEETVAEADEEAVAAGVETGVDDGDDLPSCGLGVGVWEGTDDAATDLAPDGRGWLTAA
jgi:hypothetical protein